jgi:predicted phosphodiesterase
MRIAAVSDIHGNLPALEAVLEDIAQAAVDLTVNLGDIVSGPLWPAQTAQQLMALGWPGIAGNHERQVLTTPRERLGASDAYAAQSLDAAQRAWLAALPPRLQLLPQVLCVHGSPDDDLEPLLETVTGGLAGSESPGVRAATAAEAAQRLGGAMPGVPHALVLCGHTHRPRVLQLDDGRLLVNPGSVGLQAFDDDHPVPYWIETGSPHARYALLTLGRRGWQVELRSLPYDFDAAARQAQAAGRGDWADALRSGRVGRTEAQCLPGGGAGAAA